MPFNAARASSAPAGAHLTYYGGRVISNVQVVQVIYGSGTYLPQTTSTGSPSVKSFYSGVTQSPYFDWLTEYNSAGLPSPTSNQTIGRGTYGGLYTITPSTANNGSTIQDSNIQAELAAQIDSGALPAPTTDAAGNRNTLYTLFFRHGQSICDSGSCSLVAGGFCAYHGTFVHNGADIYYAVEPDLAGVSGCGSSTDFNNTTSVASHELVEAVTDAEVGLATSSAPPLAWYDNTNGEIGDICNGQQGSVVGGDGVSYTVQTEFSNQLNNCIVQKASTTNDFSLAVSPSTRSIAAGTSTTYTVSTAVTSGAAQTVSLGVSGLPAGATASFSPASVTAGGSSTLTVTTAASTPAATSTLTITGTATSGTHSTPATLTVTGTTASNDFSIAVSPATRTVTAGTSTTYTVSTAVTAGSAQTVTLSATGLPSGASASFSPASVTAGGSSTFTVTTTASTPVGTSTLSITGTATSGTHATTASLTVTGSTTSGVVNGGFETGTLSGWTAAGASESVVGSGAHSGTYADRNGATTPTNGDSSTSQTFTAPTGATQLSFWYRMTCPDTVTYDWATATVKDNTAGTTATVLPRTCTTNAWMQVTASITAGHSYTLTLTSHDDNYSGDPSYTLFDDVTTSSPTPPPTGISNGGFETGTLASWLASGASESIVGSGAHGGTYADRSGNTTPTNGDSSITQSFVAPAGATHLSFWYRMTCPDTVTYDWATATVKDATTGTTATVLPRTCTTNAWTQVTAAITAGHSYTLTLTSHDDNYSGDPSYTLFDDVTTS